jgi:hypothetical protein
VILDLEWPVYYWIVKSDSELISVLSKSQSQLKIVFL